MPCFDLSPRLKLRLTGSDRVRFLNGQVTNDVRKANAHLSMAACVLSAKGAHAGVSMYEMGGKEPIHYAVCTEDGPATVAAEPLFQGNPEG